MELNEISDFFKGKQVALIGNAQSLLDFPRPEIDSFDTVVRINKGPIVANEHRGIGVRTDINFVSAFQGSMSKLINMSQYTIYMSPLKRESALLNSEQLLFYPLEWWDELYEEVGHRPSTGCMGIDLITRMIGDGELHLFGFDFWKTPTSYNGIRRPGPHCPSSEEKFALKMLNPLHVHRY